MKPSDLKSRLTALPIPPASATARERALHRALIALKHPAPEPSPSSVGLLRRRFAFGLLALALLVVGAIAFPLMQRHGSDLVAIAKTLHEMETLFPRQLNAIVEKNGEIRLDLAPTPDAPDVPAQEPVYVELRRGDQLIRVVSYSGRRVTLSLDGEPLTFEPLITGSGEVILVGENFIWPDAGARYRITARSLLSS